MASKNTIPSYNEDEQLNSLRPGLTDDVPDPAAAPDPVNEGALKMFHEQTDYQSKFPASGKKA